MSDTPVRARLAIDGGEPVRSRMLPYGRQSITDDDVRAVVEVLRSDWITTGPKVREFEEAFAAAVGAKHAVAFSSGTAALHGAVFAAGLAAGDEAITTPLTFCATSNAMLYQGATPIFADVIGDTMNVDPARVEQAVTSRTKAIVPVHFAGHAAEMDALLAVADRHGLAVIEDASHALGGVYRGRPIGSIGHLTTFSFHPVKHLTTGEGGMVTTSDEARASSLRAFRSHGIDSDLHARQARGDWRYEMRELGYNYRLSDIGCALGLSQLPRLEQGLMRRRQIALRYDGAFRNLPGVQPPVVRPGVEHAWHLYPIRLDPAVCDRDRMFEALRAEGIGVNVHYAPVPHHPYYRDRFGFRGGEFPIAEDASSRMLSLPMFHAMSEADVDDVIRAVTKVCAAHA